MDSVHPPLGLKQTWVGVFWRLRLVACDISGDGNRTKLREMIIHRILFFMVDLLNGITIAILYGIRLKISTRIEDTTE
jgi:hypothetical protein